MINDHLPDGATPLSPDDTIDLIPSGISTRVQLDQFESTNIQQALQWAFSGKRKPKDLLTVDFCLRLHARMFDKTWRWAGQFRQREVNIGNTAPTMVSVALRNLCDDAKAWIDYDSYPTDEIGIRFHAKMVNIHPFTNGNGRHSRIMADLLLISLGRPPFSWGNAQLNRQSNARTRYISAIRMTDKGNFSSLLEFARS